MENIVKKLDVVETKPSRLVLENRKLLELSGVSKVISINESGAVVLTNGTKLYIEGGDISIEKLDVESGILILSGNFNEIKYSGKNARVSFFRRLFK